MNLTGAFPRKHGHGHGPSSVAKPLRRVDGEAGAFEQLAEGEFEIVHGDERLEASGEWLVFPAANGAFSDVLDQRNSVLPNQKVAKTPDLVVIIHRLRLLFTTHYPLPSTSLPCSLAPEHHHRIGSGGA